MRKSLSELSDRFREALVAVPAPHEPTTPKKGDAARGPSPDVHQRRDVKWEISPRVRCDILAYAGVNCGGQLTLVRVFPNGKHSEELDGTEFKSVMIAGPLGVRVTFATTTADEWQEHPWRAVRLLEATTFTARNGRPAIKVPDLDTLDRPDAYRANSEVQQSFPVADSLDGGDGWTFGRPGLIKDRVRVIYVDKE